jgi:acetylcholinesterase
LALFGFLCFDDPNAPCNAGLYDQLLGLEWVQRNVAAFGGDPDNVTLFGESAGSVSVSLHLLSPLSRDKFHRAILQSGTANMPWATISMAEGRLRSEELAVTYIGCPRTSDVAALVECLRQVDASKLVEEQWVSRGILQFPFLPVVDGTFLPESPELMLEHRSFKQCPILIGFNRNEGSWFLVYELGDRLTVENTDRSPREPLEVRAGDVKLMPRDQYLITVNLLFFYFPHYRHELNSSFARDAIAFQYTDWSATTQDDSSTNIGALDAAVGDSNFVCPLSRFALAYAAAGNPVYMYYFTERYEASPWPQWMGVLHGDEILFMFGQVLTEKPIVTTRGNWRLTYSAGEKRLSRAMMRYWTNFGKTG